MLTLLGSEAETVLKELAGVSVDPAFFLSGRPYS
jgi:hypothetical protein